MSQSKTITARDRAAATAKAFTQPCVWSLVGREWGFINPDSFRPPSWMLATVEVRFNGEMPPDIIALLPLAGRLIRNIARTQQALLLPSFKVHNSNVSPQEWSGLSGFCSWKSQGILIGYANQEPWDFLDTCLHEAWHACEFDLTASDFNIVRRSVATGPALPGDYYSAPEERTARAFTAYALYRLSVDAALKPTRTTLDTCNRTAADVFEEVLTGIYNPLLSYRDDGAWISVAHSCAADVRDAFAWLAKQADKLTAQEPTRRTK